MSAASAAVSNGIIYVHYLTSTNIANGGVFIGLADILANRPSPSATVPAAASGYPLQIQEQSLAPNDASPLSISAVPKSAFMVATSTKEFLVAANMPSGGPVIMRISPSATNSAGNTNPSWTLADGGKPLGLLPSTSITQMSISSGTTSTAATSLPDGSALFQIYPSVDSNVTDTAVKFDISNLGAAAKETWSYPFTGLDMTSLPKVVRLSGMVVSNYEVAMLGKCSSSTGTCLQFYNPTANANQGVSRRIEIAPQNECWTYFEHLLLRKD